MIDIRKSSERGRANHGWLDTHFTFSFADYFDPEHVQFRTLRVMNDDRVEPGQGFPTHPHRDMEIVTYVLEGALEHKDSMGNGSTIRPGDVQRMSAGRGVLHSEFNPSPTERVRFLQIWVLPERRGGEPGYEQKAFPRAEREGKLRLIASRGGDEGSVALRRDARIHSAILAPGQRAELGVSRQRKDWVQAARGSVTLNGVALAEGDGAAMENEERVALSADSPAEILGFDLA